jgi:sulfotransferase family protein
MNIDEFTPENVLAAAQRQTGLSKFRHMRFLAGMERMIASMRDESCLNESGVAQQFRRFVGLTSNRLLADRLFTEKPEILDQPLGELTVIIGLPRTGTTKLQRVLSRHPDLNFITGWEVLMPVPFSGDKAGPDDPRRAMVANSLAEQDKTQPEMKAIHEIIADEAEEDSLLMLHSFTNAALFNVQIPGYTNWFQEQDVLWTYEELLDYLKLLQWQHDRIGRSWILKNVLHIAHLEALLKVAPSAKLVWIHRDPAQAISSWSSLVSTIREPLSDHVDRREVGAEQLDFWHWAAELGMSSRDALPGDQFIDIPYRDVVSDLRAVLEEILAFSSLERSDAVLDRLLAWETNNQQAKHGAHRYALEDFGLSTEQIHQKFDSYMHRYGLV